MTPTATIRIMRSVSYASYRPALPVGERCSHARVIHDGRAPNEWDWTIDAVKAEMQALWDNALDPRLTWAQHADYRGSLKTLIGKAKQGTLVISEHSGADAKVIRDVILELRPVLKEDARPAFGRRPRRLRLYYGEPATVEFVLLGLHLDTKEAAESGNNEQNEAIEEAIQRAHNWARAA